MTLNKTPLLTVDDIIAAFRDGHTVFWRSAKSTLMRTNSGYFNVETATGKDKYILTHLPTLIKKFGVKDFYFLENTDGRE
tara:strand:+ start:500 stop:739 length:240 start_codon:yes stop_codon:yes gene_type:complete